MKIVNCKLIILSLLIFISLFSSVLSASGQGAISPSLSISPGLVRLIVKPGEKTIVPIKVTNLGQNPIPLGVAKFNISGINNLGAPEFTTTVRPQSAIDWLKVDQPNLILDALASREIAVTIEAPEGIDPGGYSVALIFQASLPPEYFDSNANTRILPALSTSFLLSVEAETPPTLESLSISSFQTPIVVVSSPIPFLAEISNPTGFFFFTDGELTLKPIWGEQKIVTRLASSVLMPGSSRQYTSAYTGVIWPGIYEAKFTLHQGDEVLVSSARFVSVPWLFIVSTFLIAALTVGLWLRFRHRRI